VDVRRQVPAVRRVVSADIPTLAAMLVRSFDDDPVANFMFAGDRRRRAGLHAFFVSQLRRQYLPLGHVYTTGDLDGAALWGPPDINRNGLKELVRLLSVAPFVASTRAHRALKLLFEIDGLHPKERHWYLATLGTDPSRQGEGLGSGLLRSMVDHIDELGDPAYLESSKERNVPFYARFGFEVIDEFRSDVGGPPIWRMWRAPRAPDTFTR
jgi:GNAT superfamily N-acetyltransferase